MKANDLRQKDVAALEKELLELRREQFSLRMQQATGQLSRFHKFREVGRSIARIKTVLHEKRAGERQ